MDIYRCPKCGMEMTAKLWWSLGSLGKCPSGCGEFIDKFVKIDGQDKTADEIAKPLDIGIDEIQAALGRVTNKPSLEEQAAFIDALNEIQKTMADRCPEVDTAGAGAMMRADKTTIGDKVAREREKGSRIAERLIDHGLKMLAKKGMIPVTMIHDGLLVTGKVTFEIDEKEEVLR